MGNTLNRLDQNHYNFRQTTVGDYYGAKRRNKNYHKRELNTSIYTSRGSEPTGVFRKNRIYDMIEGSAPKLSTHHEFSSIVENFERFLHSFGISSTSVRNLIDLFGGTLVSKYTQGYKLQTEDGIKLWMWIGLYMSMQDKFPKTAFFCLQIVGLLLGYSGHYNEENTFN